MRLLFRFEPSDDLTRGIVQALFRGEVRRLPWKAVPIAAARLGGYAKDRGTDA
jgi:hypothetical protein